VVREEWERLLPRVAKLFCFITSTVRVLARLACVNLAANDICLYLSRRHSSYPKQPSHRANRRQRCPPHRIDFLFRVATKPFSLNVCLPSTFARAVLRWRVTEASSYFLRRPVWHSLPLRHQFRRPRGKERKFPSRPSIYTSLPTLRAMLTSASL